MRDLAYFTSRRSSPAYFLVALEDFDGVVAVLLRGVGFGGWGRGFVVC